MMQDHHDEKNGEYADNGMARTRTLNRETSQQGMPHLAPTRTQATMQTAQTAHTYREPPLIVSQPISTTLGSPTALAIGAFATSLTTLSFALMGWRGVTVSNAFIGDFFFIAGIGMIISAQWELVRGNSFGYTVFTAFGFFYSGYGAIVTPIFGVKQAYADNIVEYNNALGFWVLMWGILNLFFLIGSIPISLIYIGIFAFVELAFLLIGASYFATADGNISTGTALMKAGGAFAFCSAMCGWYTLANLMCQQTFFFSFPMGDTSRFFQPRMTEPKAAEQLEGP